MIASVLIEFTNPNASYKRIGDEPKHAFPLAMEMKNTDALLTLKAGYCTRVHPGPSTSARSLSDHMHGYVSVFRPAG